MEKYTVKLTEDEREYLMCLIKTGKSSAKKLTYARILLETDEKHGEGYKKTDEAIGKLFHVSYKTVKRVRKQCVEEGLEAALTRKVHSRVKPRRLNGDQEAHLIALACSQAPEGQVRWTLKLLADKLIEMEIVDTVGRTTIHETLKKTNLSLG